MAPDPRREMNKERLECYHSNSLTLICIAHAKRSSIEIRWLTGLPVKHPQ
jgi:hypothetical protein